MSRLDMNKQYETSYATKDGKLYRSYMMDESSVPFWTPGKGEHELDIIPYRVGEHDPRVLVGKMRKGEWAYVLDFFVHNKIGGSDLTHLCLKACFNLPCPVHKEIEKMKKLKDFDEDEIKKHYEKRRCLYNVIIRDGGKEEAKGVQVLDIAHFSMEKELVLKAKKKRGGGFIPFADPDDGMTVYFERTGVGMNNTRYAGHEFLDRQKPITDNDLDRAICLDSLLYVPTYEEVERILHGGFTFSEGEREKDEEEDYEDDIPDNPSGLSHRSLKTFDTPPPVSRELCFGNGKFGRDFRKLDLCGDCPVYAECAVEYEKLGAEEK